MAVEIKEMVIRTKVLAGGDEEEAGGESGRGMSAEEITELKTEIIQECLHKVAEMIADLGEH